MNQPLISVCIPVYNCAPFIGLAIESVLKQSCQDFEIVVVDNCSTDNTVEEVRSYSDSRIRLFQNSTNIGMIPNFSKSVSHASGKYIKILPADDLLYPDCLQLQSQILEADKEEKISLVCGSRNVINDAGKVLFSRSFSSSLVELSGPQAINKVIRSGGNIIGEGGAVMFRRSVMAKTGEFNSFIFYVLDLDHWFKILMHGNLVAIPQVVSAFRVSASSASVNIADKQKKDYFNFIDLVKSRPEYGLTGFNYRFGKLKTWILTQVKKLIYRFVVK